MLTQLADAVTAWLNHEDRDWSLEFTAERSIDTTRSQAELQTLTVTVTPFDLARERDDRAEVAKEYMLSIGVRQRVATTTNEVLDPLVQLVEDIAETSDGLCLGVTIGDTTRELLVDVATTPLVGDPGWLKQNLFVGAVALTFIDLG